ncbi:MAG TPA: nucleotide exchange factor GrpE [Clostridiales bacterium]|nr:nucleotide exchange factor GrpE [Clostridiales bacterium]
MIEQDRGQTPDSATLTGAGATPSPGAESLLAELEAARREARESEDRFLRAVADHENYRRRMDRDLAAHIRRGKGELLRGILDLADGLELAARSPTDGAGLRLGLEVIQRQLAALLDKEGVSVIAAQGLPFDPTVHEALLVEEDPSAGQEVVREELRRGYCWCGELLRPARVRVARPAHPRRDEPGPLGR